MKLYTIYNTETKQYLKIFRSYLKAIRYKNTFGETKEGSTLRFAPKWSDNLKDSHVYTKKNLANKARSRVIDHLCDIKNKDSKFERAIVANSVKDIIKIKEYIMIDIEDYYNQINIINTLENTNANI